MKIDLGKKMDMEAMPQPVSVSQSEMHYPTLYLDLPSGSGKDLPEEGTMTVEFKRESYTESERNGKKTCSVSLSIKSLDNIEGEKSDEYERTKAEAALDKAKKDVEEADEENE